MPETKLRELRQSLEQVGRITRINLGARADGTTGFHPIEVHFEYTAKPPGAVKHKTLLLGTDIRSQLIKDTRTGKLLLHPPNLKHREAITSVFPLT